MALFESVRNYYEQLVFAKIRETLGEGYFGHEDRFLEAVACAALNQLPARYLREDLGAGPQLSQSERESMELAVYNAVQNAIDVVRQHSEGVGRELGRAGD